MGGKKKQFIKKGEGVKFFLAHRSQKDPLYLDETLGERVLVPVDPEAVDNDLVNSLNGLSLKKTFKKDRDEQKFKRIEEQHKFGIYYDDDYDYLQHLRDADQEETAQLEREPDVVKIGSVLIKTDEFNEDEDKPKLQLPSSVFASKVEEEIGYFNQAAPDHNPKIDWDPDIVKILDEDDVEYEDDLEDDFFIKANEEGEEDEEDDEEEDDDEDEEEDYDSDDLHDEESESESVEEFETKSRFSNYSMTSSVIRRNEALTQLDAQFEKFFSQYDEDQIGALDTEEIDGFRMNDQVLESALEEFNKYVQKNKYQPEKKSARPNLGVLVEENSGAESNEEEEETDDNNNYEIVHFCKKKEKEERFDCESIISTYSNLYNHPAIISERSEKIQLSKKSGLPLGVFSEKQKSLKEMDRIDHKITRILPEVPKRTKEETKEEKKARKQAVKEHRRERRVEKKINKLAFKDEKKCQANQIKSAMDNSNIVHLP